MPRRCSAIVGSTAQPDFDTAHFVNGFPTPGGKFKFRPDWKARGKHHARMPELPDHMDSIESAHTDCPFRLVTAPARSFLNTTFNQNVTSRNRERRPTVLIHPRDCAKLNVESGDRVVIGNGRGEVVVHAQAFDGLQPGVVVVEGIWPNTDFENRIGINSLVGADPVAPNGGAAFHDNAVWVKLAA